MFTIKMRAATEAEQNLRQLAAKLDWQIEEAERVFLQLRKISEYDQQRRELRRHLENMREEKQQMTELLKALEEIQRIYGLAERNVTDYGERILK